MRAISFSFAVKTMAAERQGKHVGVFSYGGTRRIVFNDLA
jgi:hypothetical protein